MNTAPRYLRTPAAAAYLGIAAQTMERWRIYGLGPPFVKLSGRVVVYRVLDLEAWCESRRKQSTSERTP